MKKNKPKQILGNIVIDVAAILNGWVTVHVNMVEKESREIIQTIYIDALQEGGRINIDGIDLPLEVIEERMVST